MMTRGVPLLLLVMPLGAASIPQLEHDLDEIARVATVMMDGDICQRIVTPRAVQFLSRTDPRDHWAADDNYDVDDESFIRTKKTLIRLAQLVNYPLDVNLWMPVGDASRVHIVIRNRYEMSQFWEWGNLTQDMFPEMRAVLRTGERVKVQRKPGFISVLAPVRNSLGDIVGAVEVVSRVQPDARENVK